MERYEFYVIASRHLGHGVSEAKIVAGPLTHGAAETEARSRIDQSPPGFKFSIVELDPEFGLDHVPM